MNTRKTIAASAAAFGIASITFGICGKTTACGTVRTRRRHHGHRMRVVGGMTAVYLSLKQVGERLGVKNAAAYRLPEPDAMIGTTRGWLPETIDRWNAARPGRGVGGGRPRKEER